MQRDISSGWGNSKIFILCVFALCIYLFVIFQWKSIPFSDFKSYNDTARDIIQGKSISDFYKYFQPAGYPYLLSILFRLFKNNSILLPQLLNALMLSVLLWVYLKYPFGSYSISLFIGYLIMVSNVNYLSMVSVLCSEIPYVFFFLTGLFFFWQGFKEIGDERFGKKRWWPLSSLISGLFLGTSQFIRPLTFLYLFIFSLVLLLGLRYFELIEATEKWKVFFLRGVRSLFFTWIFFFIGAILFYWVSGYGLTWMPLQKGLWSLYVGFNTQSKGEFNSRDAKMILEIGDKHQWNAEKINKDFRGIVFDRLRKNWVKNFELLPGKLYTLMNPRGIPYFAIEQSNVKNKDRIYKISGYLSWINAGVLIVSLWAWVIWLTKRRVSKEEFFGFCAVGAVFLHLVFHGYLLEVQARYSNHLWMILFWCFPLSLWILWENIFKRNYTEKHE